jgi:hypothetical protein
MLLTFMVVDLLSLFVFMVVGLLYFDSTILISYFQLAPGRLPMIFITFFISVIDNLNILPTVFS